MLNAKEHAREADIVVQAGSPGVITVATNMAGRGTDIVLGGNPEPEIKGVESDDSLSAEEKRARIDKIRADWQVVHDQVLAAGGLHIVGTERHESRRIDNQLRGRSGRQGDPVPPVSTCAWKTRCCASSRPTASPRSWTA